MQLSQRNINPRFNVASTLVVGGELDHELSTTDKYVLHRADSDHIIRFVEALSKEENIRFTNSSEQVGVSNIEYSDIDNEGDFLEHPKNADMLVLAHINTQETPRYSKLSPHTNFPDAWKIAIDSARPKVIALITDNSNIVVNEHDIPEGYKEGIKSVEKSSSPYDYQYFIRNGL